MLPSQFQLKGAAMRVATLVLCIALAVLPGRADDLTLKSGESVTGVILQETANFYTVQTDYTVAMVGRTDVVKVTKKPAPNSGPSTQPNNRIPDWNITIQVLAQRPWATLLHSIPATVVDVGAMRAVPYQSYKCGLDYELNIYGDPDRPGAIEIGIYRDLLQSNYAKDMCIQFVASILPDRKDAELLRKLEKSGGKVTSGDITIEITPPTAEDAYGGWWVSVYSEEALEKARATEAELAAITVEKNSFAAAAPTTATPEVNTTTWTPSEIAQARPYVPPASTAKAAPSRYPTTQVTQPPQTSGRVYVRGYFRKDGTYVRPHSRKKR
jgi:hypothetical protein